MTEKATRLIQLTPTRQDVRIAWLAALAISLHILESAVPMPLPGIKPGLANIVTLFTLLRYGLSEAIWVSVIRVLAGSLIIGSFLTPTFFLSLAGMSASIGMLALFYHSPLKPGPIGYSLVAAQAHISGQFLTAYFLFIPHPGMWNLLPFLLSFAIVLGVLNGIITRSLLRRLQ